jgi:hypothetical protein
VNLTCQRTGERVVWCFLFVGGANRLAEAWQETFPLEVITEVVLDIFGEDIVPFYTRPAEI